MNTLNSYFRLLLVAFFLIPGMASAIEGQLLGVTRDNPLIDASIDTALLCGYDGTTLLVQSQADFIEFTAGGTTALIFSDMTGTVTGGLFEISAQIDNTGALVGGTFTVSGAYLEGVVKGDPNPILTGDIVDFGIRDNGNTDPADFRIANLSGDLTTSPDWPAGATNGAVNVTLLNSLYAGTASATGFGAAWNCDGANGNSGTTPAVGGTVPFDCYAVNKVTIKNKSGTNKDEIKVSKAGFRLDAPNTVDLSVDTTTIAVGTKTYTFLPGSFVLGGSGDYKFKTASGTVPKIEARLNFTKATWELKVKGDDTSGFAAGSIDVTLTINGFSSTETITLLAKGSDKLEYKANPKTTCRRPTSDSSDSGTPSSGKLSCISEMTVRYDNGVDPIELITKTRVAGELLHPNTVYSDTLNNDLGIFHTSCSQCITCGDVDGNFTIVDIDVLPGDKLSQKCLVPDASCTLP